MGTLRDEKKDYDTLPWRLYDLAWHLRLRRFFWWLAYLDQIDRPGWKVGASLLRGWVLDRFCSVVGHTSVYKETTSKVRGGKKSSYYYCTRCGHPLRFIDGPEDVSMLGFNGVHLRPEKPYKIR